MKPRASFVFPGGIVIDLTCICKRRMQMKNVLTRRITFKELFLTLLLASFPTENPAQIGRGYVAITILDINDNAPEFAMEYETTVCENAQPGQVWLDRFFYVYFYEIGSYSLRNPASFKIKYNQLMAGKMML